MTAEKLEPAPFRVLVRRHKSGKGYIIFVIRRFEGHWIRANLEKIETWYATCPYGRHKSVVALIEYERGDRIFADLKTAETFVRLMGGALL